MIHKLESLSLINFHIHKQIKCDFNLSFSLTPNFIVSISAMTTRQIRLASGQLQVAK